LEGEGESWAKGAGRPPAGLKNLCSKKNTDERKFQRKGGRAAKYFRETAMGKGGKNGTGREGEKKCSSRRREDVADA